MERKILLTVVKPDSERCLIDAPADLQPKDRAAPSPL